MARLWSSGFELNSATAGVEWDASSSASIQTTTKRSGTYAAQFTSFTSGVNKRILYQFLSAAGSGPYFFRTYFRIDTLPTAENRILLLNSLLSTGTPEVYITINDTGSLTLYDEDGAIGSASSALSTSTWYRIELQFDITAAAGSHVVRALLDGSEFAGSATRNISVGILCFGVGGNLALEAQTTGNWFFDDVAINDSTGSFQNSYPGEGEIIHLRPNAAGDNADWSDAFIGDPWEQIEEVTPDDATSYIQNSDLGTSDFNLDATPAAMDSDDTINCVQVGWRFRAASVVGTQPITVLRIAASSGGTVEESGNITLSTATWNTNATASPKNYQLTLYDLPGASSTAWTKADLDTTQIGVRNTNDPTPQAQVSTLWLLVDHKPAGGGGPPETAVKDIIGPGLIAFAR